MQSNQALTLVKRRWHQTSGPCVTLSVRFMFTLFEGKICIVAYGANNILDDFSEKAYESLCKLKCGMLTLWYTYQKKDIERILYIYDGFIDPMLPWRAKK